MFGFIFSSISTRTEMHITYFTFYNDNKISWIKKHVKMSARIIYQNLCPVLQSSWGLDGAESIVPLRSRLVSADWTLPFNQTPLLDLVMHSPIWIGYLQNSFVSQDEA